MRGIVLLAACALAGCQDRGSNAQDGSPPISITTKEGGKIDAADGKLAIDVPGLQAKVNLPDFQIGGENMDIDGMTLAPDTKITGINVDAQSEAGAGVVMRFTNPRPPAELIEHYRRAAAEHGFQVAPQANGVRATKSDKDVTIEVRADGAGSSGTIATMERR